MRNYILRRLCATFAHGIARSKARKHPPPIYSTLYIIALPPKVTFEPWENNSFINLTKLIKTFFKIILKNLFLQIIHIS